MRTAPSQREITTLVSDLLKFGSQEKVANILNVKPCDISRRLNPLDDRKLSLVEGLRELWAVAGADPEAFRGIRAYLETLFDSWELPSTLASLPVLVIAADKEAGEVIRAFAAGKPIHEQRAEALQAIAALQAYVQGLEVAQIREARK